MQAALIAASGACAGPDLVGGGCSCSCSCKYLLHPTPTFAGGGN